MEFNGIDLFLSSICKAGCSKMKTFFRELYESIRGL
jgi:hypothetical protein